MDHLDPTTANNLDDLAACLRHVHIRADRPTYRALEQQTIHTNGLLPGTRLKRIRLTRSIVSDVLLGRKFPSKAFLLTLVDACGIDLQNDRRWEQAWDRLAVQYQRVSPPLGEVERLRQENEVERLRQENEELRQQLAASDEALAKLRERLVGQAWLADQLVDEAGKKPRMYIPSRETVHVPLVRRIPASGPFLDQQHTEGIFPLPKQLVGEGNLFILEMAGDSMIGAAIADGNRVVVREQPLAQNGNIVAAAIDGEATVKTFKQRDGHIWLIPHNPSYTEISGDEARILGRVVAVLRRV